MGHDTVNDSLSADVRLYDTTLEILSDSNASGIRVKPGQISTEHLSAGSVTNAKLANDTITINNNDISRNTNFENVPKYGLK